MLLLGISRPGARGVRGCARFRSHQLRWRRTQLCRVVLWHVRMLQNLRNRYPSYIYPPAVVFPIRHLLRTGEIRDLVIVSERQMVKGVSRIIAVTGGDAKAVGKTRNFY